MPVLSIITINFNNKFGLQKTVLSVIAQNNSDTEYIIIDGGSTDGSLDVIETNKKNITYSISEKDNGIYDAQNKGIQKAKGDYLLFLNSGDTLYNEKVVSDFYNFIANKNYGVVYGNSNLKYADKPDAVLCPPQQLDLNYFFKRNLNHQACFIRRNLFERFGFYNTAYKICADFDFFFNVFVNAPESYAYFNYTVCNYEDGGLSSVKENYNRMVSEKETILRSYLSKKEYLTNYKKHRKEVPLKYRILEQIYKVPFLNWLFKKVYLTVKNR